MRPDPMNPSVTAGLIWQPEIGPIAYTSAANTSPKANAVATTPAAMLPVIPRPSRPPKILNPNASAATPTATTTRIIATKKSDNSYLTSGSGMHDLLCPGEAPGNPLSWGFVDPESLAARPVRAADAATATRTYRQLT